MSASATECYQRTMATLWLKLVLALAIESFLCSANSPCNSQFAGEPAPRNMCPILYTILAPRTIRPYSTYELSLSLSIEPRVCEHSPCSCVQPTAIDIVTSIAPYANTTMRAYAYTRGPVRIQIPSTPSSTGGTATATALVQIAIELKSLPEPSYRLTVKGTATSPTDTRTTEGCVGAGGERIFEDSSIVVQVPREQKVSLLFLHTDKPIYKPGETVRFRVVVLDRDLKPYAMATGSATPLLNVIIFDSRRNVIKSWPAVSVARMRAGIFSANLTLSSEPVLGDWVIQAELLRMNCDEGDENICSSKHEPYPDSFKSVSFSVDRYVLPKFFVEVLLPPFVTFNDSRFVAHVKASYTYGKPLQNGQVIIMASVQKPNANPFTATVTKHVQLRNGSAFVEFDFGAKELNLVDGANDQPVMLIVHASVLDPLTGKRHNASSTVTVHKHRYKLSLLSEFGSESDHTNANYKPGLPFIVTIRVTTQDDLPVQDPAPDALTVKHPFSYTAEGGVYKAPVPANGLVRVTFHPPSNELLEIRSQPGFEVTYKGVSQWFVIPERVTTESKVYLQLSIEGDTVTADGQELLVKVKSNKPFKVIHYQLVGSDGQILTAGVHKHGEQDEGTSQPADEIGTQKPSNETILTVRVPYDAGPIVSIIAFIYAYSDNEPNVPEIVSDSIKIMVNMAGRLRNQLNITLASESENGTSVQTREPGENVTFELRTRPGSLVALRGVDQSVLLLKEDKDIDLKTVHDELDRIDDRQRQSDRGSTGRRCANGQMLSHSAYEFYKAGLLILTNARTDKPTYSGCEIPRSSGLPRFFEYEEEVDIQPGGYTPSPPLAVEPLRVRTHFPETWLWEEVEAGTAPDLINRLTKTIPDSLTSWIITGYSIHPEFGLGILDRPQKLTVVRPFFITLNMPHSVVFGEVLAVQVLVHNYLGREAEVNVTLDNARGEFKFLEGSGSQSHSRSQETVDPGFKKVRIRSSTVGSVTFTIVPAHIGIIELSVRAHAIAVAAAEAAGDALSRPLVVRPPGMRQTMNKVALIDHRINSSMSMLRLEASFPPDAHRVTLAGADHVQISIVSDVLGPAISNLGDLLQMPYGCGEQNLVNFVPDILVLDYLTKTGQLTPEIKGKALRFLESGYQRQLTYAHDDGSFSAFGASDSHGSTWLTAFTIKSLHAAKPYITVDEDVIRRGLRFLARQQDRQDGWFKEPGRVLHAELQGGTSNGKGKGTDTGGIALTAYVLLTFIEIEASTFRSSDLTLSGHRAVIDKGLQYLVSKVTNNTQDIYSLVLVSYVLELAKHPLRETIRAQVEKHAKTSVDGEFKHWEQKQSADEHSVGQTKPVSVEMSAYRLLTYLATRDLTAALPVLKWLIAQRNAAGGFMSTQDTVVGLVALAKFAEIAHESNNGMGGDVGLSILAIAEDKNADAVNASNSATWSVHVGKDNAIVLQTVELPSSTRAVTFQTSGHGTALVQLTNTFYVETGINLAELQSPAFDIDVRVRLRAPSLKYAFNLVICTEFILAGTPKSNMAVLEVNLPTGYNFDADADQLDKIRTLPRVMRVDLTESDSQLNIYYDHLYSNSNSAELSCVSLNANLVHRVANQSRAYVRVYDYYDTTRTGFASYEAPKLDWCPEGEKEDKNCI